MGGFFYRFLLHSTEMLGGLGRWGVGGGGVVTGCVCAYGSC